MYWNSATSKSSASTRLRSNKHTVHIYAFFSHYNVDDVAKVGQPLMDIEVDGATEEAAGCVDKAAVEESASVNRLFLEHNYRMFFSLLSCFQPVLCPSSL